MESKFEVGVYIGVLASKFVVGVLWCDGDQVRGWCVGVMASKLEVVVC